MMKPEFSKPFDLAAARAGAPFCGDNGEAVRILLWDRKHPTYPIIAIEERGEQEAIAFRADGKCDAGESLGLVSQLVMLPLGLIDGKPVFVGDLVQASPRGEQPELVNAFVGMTFPAGHAWSWPAPAKVYPETLMTNSQLYDAFDPKFDGVWNSITAANIANAALRHAVDAGQLVDAEQSAEAIRTAHADGQAIAYKQEAGGRAARDMAIAEAVRQRCRELVGGSHITNLDLTTVIAAVK